MSITQKLILLLVGIVAGFAVGFAFANTANRTEQDRLRAEVARLRAGAPPADAAKNGLKASASPAGGAAPETLSDEEIRAKVAQADANPQDITYQRDLGRGLYLYAMNFGKAELMPDVVRLLKRVHESDPKDDNAVILVANALFLMGQSDDPARYAEARAYYQKALDLKPDDVYARTALGLSYYFDRPSDPARAIKEYRKSLALDARHEMTLQGLAAALIATGELAEAEKRLDELQSVNAANAELPNLRAQLAQKKSSSQAQGAGASAARRNAPDARN